jgi:hypothetical protein
LQSTYEHYLHSPQLSAALMEDTHARFGHQSDSGDFHTDALTRSIAGYLQVVTASRNLRVF